MNAAVWIFLHQNIVLGSFWPIIITLFKYKSKYKIWTILESEIWAPENEKQASI